MTLTTSLPAGSPAHVAVIMDGNGRWAQSRGRPRVYGHIRGAGRVREVVTAARKSGVKALTLFAFSTENWSRPSSELQVLWKILTKFLRREVEDLDRQGIRLRTLGEIHRLQPEVRALLNDSIAKLAHNSAMELTLCISYGGRGELVAAARRVARSCLEGTLCPEEIDEQRLGSFLESSQLGDLSDVDLLIRTSGEKRISNFLLWQMAYAEMLFIDKPWPEFRAKDFQAALEQFGKRERRFGGLAQKAIG